MATSLKIRTIDCAGANAEAEILAIRDRLGLRGDVVSAQGRRLTEEVFGAPLSPREVVERICEDVRRRGREAVLDYSRKLDRADYGVLGLQVPRERMQDAHRAASPEFLGAVRRIRQNILTFQSAILHQDAVMAMSDHELRLIYRPLRRVGVCIPGGAAAYPSTLLMTVIPAQAAGVRSIAVVAPPTPFGADNLNLLAACHELGVTEVYRMGGAQAIAALAYGIDGVEAVDKIVGPGNLFVALAKQKVSEACGIDMIAGPTEVVVLADKTANPAYVAADLLSQAEHAPGASLLITWSRELIQPVLAALEEQLSMVDRGGLARESLENFGALLIAANEEEACKLSDRIAPEHLQIETADPEGTLRRIRHAGAVFLGHFTPVAVGDYVAGPSHTLPTGGAARYSSGLSSNDFLKRTSVIHYSPAKLRAVADDLRVMAATEGLTAHSQSVDLRLPSTDGRAKERASLAAVRK